ncbi:AAA family ATPase [Cellulomonas triticagri]|nr:ATP-binding protein [Cellulomonas triticagri]
MLIAFSVANFRAIREEQRMLFTRAGGGHRSRLDLDAPTPGGVTPVLALYGANASGKSTVLEALYWMRHMVRDSARWEAGSSVPIQPFHFDEPDDERPMSFEVQIRLGDSEYRYGFEALADRFTAEWLYQTPLDATRKVERRLFERRTSEDGVTTVDATSYLKGRKSAIIDATRADSLFLSRAAQENFAALLPVYAWFRSRLGPGIAGADNQPLRIRQTRELVEGSEAGRRAVERLLLAADLGIRGIAEADDPAHEVPEGFVQMITSADVFSGEAQARDFVENNRRPRLLHQVDGRPPVPFAWDDESAGTQELFALAGPVVEALAAGSVLAVDEIESSMHPLLVRAVVELFQSVESNPYGAQLLFSTHDTTLLGDFAGLGYVLDRDQIWFVEKSRHGQIELIPLTDYKPRGSSDLERQYLQGRYGAVPLLSTSLFEGRER